MAMSEYESVSELVNKTGASYNEAKYAYEACGGDMLAAIIMLEKAKGIKTEKAYDRSSENKAADIAGNVSAKAGKAINDGAKTAKVTLDKLCSKNVKISGNRDYCDMPLPAFVIIFAAGWSISVPAFVISLFCGVKYTISGKDAKDIVISFSQRSKQQCAPMQQGANMQQGMPMQQAANMQQYGQQGGSVQNVCPPQQNGSYQYTGGADPLGSEDKGFFG